MAFSGFGNNGGGGGGFGGGGGGEKPPSVFIGNLSFSVTEEDLHALVAQFAPPLRVKLLTDRDTGRSRGNKRKID